MTRHCPDCEAPIPAHPSGYGRPRVRCEPCGEARTRDLLVAWRKANGPRRAAAEARRRAAWTDEARERERARKRASWARRIALNPEFRERERVRNKARRAAAALGWSVADVLTEWRKGCSP